MGASHTVCLLELTFLAFQHRFPSQMEKNRKRKKGKNGKRRKKRKSGLILTFDKIGCLFF